MTRPKIVVTDGFTLNPGDLDWTPLEKLGELVVYDRTALAEIAERCKNAAVIVTNKTPVSAAVIHAGTALKCIAVTATGYNIIDIDAADRAGVVVCNVPGYGTDSVAQHAFALILALSNRIPEHAESVRNGDWVTSPDWSYALGPFVELAGKTIGIVGYGNIGSKVASIASAFGMKVLYFSRSRKKGIGDQVSLETLARESDFISLHCPLDESNKEFVNRSFIRLMKPGAFIINTARGQLIDEKDLADALNDGRVAGAGLDVLSEEPPRPDNPLLSSRNTIITPHNAWVTVEARKRMMSVTCSNIAAALEGRPQNVVNLKSRRK